MPLTTRLLRLAIVTAVFLFVFYFLSPSRPPVQRFLPNLNPSASTSTVQTPDAQRTSQQADDGWPPSRCPKLPGLEDVFVILKTGASGASTKLPIHFNTTLSCVPDYAVYSDFAETIKGHRVLDALDEVDHNIADTHPEFATYRRLKAYGKATLGPAESGRDSAGWRLDKWKFLPILEKAWRRRPDAKWFVFMEDDTYISFPNLLRYLAHHDPSTPFYAGAQMQIGDVLFAHGGSGFIISRAAMRQAVDRRRSNLAYYDDLTSREWAGDCVLGALLADAGSPVFWAWPNFQGDSPAALDYSAETENHDQLWCHAAITYHHLSAQQIQQLWDLELQWASEFKDKPMLFSDVFDRIVQAQILEKGSSASNWDSEATEEAFDVASSSSNETFGRCKQICQSHSNCVQFRVSENGETCQTSSQVRLGGPSEGIQSGWLVDRIKKFKNRMAACKKPSWVLP